MREKEGCVLDTHLVLSLSGLCVTPPIFFSFTFQKTLSGEMEGGKYLPEGFIREPAPDGKL